jgi:large subunit ribosomal protein L18
MKNNFEQRRARVRAKVVGTKDRPRLSVYRSNKAIYAQIIDDTQGKTLVSVAPQDKALTKAKTKIEKAALVGELLAQKALKAKIKKVVFDKSGYKYHGRIKAVAEGARKGGLSF